MLEPLKHECGIALVRLLKPLSYYKEKYGTYLYGLNKLMLLMEKQHNRGQEGAGLSCVKLHAQPAEEYIFRERALGTGAIQEIFGKVQKEISEIDYNSKSAEWVEQHMPFVGELYMGHLRYSTTDKQGISYIHPFLRRSNWRSQNLLLCGNFTMTNVDEIFDYVVAQGQHPRYYADTFIILEQLGYALDMENRRLSDKFREEGHTGVINNLIEDNLDIAGLLRNEAPIWDGGYVMCGQTGSGDMFAVRDPHGIRPAFYYRNDEIVVVASERPVIQTAMNIPVEDVYELSPGESIIINKNGEVTFEQILEPLKNEACSFERIYFSRGSDRDIYNERKMLGKQLTDSILKSIDYDLQHTVFSFIPNTSEVAYYGMVEGMTEHLIAQKIKLIKDGRRTLSEDELYRILKMHVRTEKVAIKDIKLRTFISETNTRNDLAAHVYDITYGTITPYIDNLVVIDDSIVRGTTLKQSILKILSRLHPKKIVIVSSSPQVLYPDFYGIDMSNMDEFIAFRATVELLKDRGMKSLIDEVYEKCIAQRTLPKEEIVNHVQEIYAPFTMEEISGKISQMLTDGIECPVEIVYQSVEGMHRAIPDHPGDWYFTGNYPTAGGNKLVNEAFIRYVEKRNKAK
ncbi:MAG: amidophosphoribosyltransferase [Bacteroidaceae bacterium]|nr:amidophosphoribosyltransferase [Bacteroidaceae bacterium]